MMSPVGSARSDTTAVSPAANGSPLARSPSGWSNAGESAVDQTVREHPERLAVVEHPDFADGLAVRAG